jgi:hypothetical protein
MRVTDELDQLLSRAEVRRLLGNVGSQYLRRWIKEGSFPPPDVIIRGRNFWRIWTVQRYLESHQTMPESPRRGRPRLPG